MAKLSTLIKGYKGDLGRIHGKSCLELGVRVVDSTPIDQGEARRRWTPNGAPTLGKIYSFTNNLPYIKPLEYGWSEQARNPDGMVRKNVRNWQSIVRGNI